MLKEALPSAARIGVLWNPTTPSHQPALKSIEAAGEKLRVELPWLPRELSKISRSHFRQ